MEDAKKVDRDAKGVLKGCLGVLKGMYRDVNQVFTGVKGLQRGSQGYPASATRRPTVARPLISLTTTHTFLLRRGIGGHRKSPYIYSMSSKSQNLGSCRFTAPSHA